MENTFGVIAFDASINPILQSKHKDIKATLVTDGEGKSQNPSQVRDVTMNVGIYELKRKYPISRPSVIFI